MNFTLFQETNIKSMKHDLRRTTQTRQWHIDTGNYLGKWHNWM